jgi:rod shape-determining protein MreD
MKKRLVYIFILLVTLIWQTSIAPVIFTGHAIGDAVLMAVLAWSILDGFYAFFGWSIIAGIFYDLMTYAIIGEHVLIFLAVVYFVSFFSRRLTLEFKGIGFLLFFVFVVAATLLSHVIKNSFVLLDIQTIHSYIDLFGPIKLLILQVIYNEILFFFWLFLLKKIKNFFNIRN